ncbi:MAG TPA: glycosyltransferase family 4 protein [Candidatus Woesebacteria bacterium]|nr:glycosyltransferase family 4 protein [Candidatus Woesebacteria bacterium]
MQQHKKVFHKIIYFVHCYPPALGGLEYLSGEIVKLLRDAGHDVQVITGKGSTLDSYKTFDNWVDETTDPTYIHRLSLRTSAQRLANKFLNKLIFLTGSVSPWYFGPLLEYDKKTLELIQSADVIIGAGMPTMMFYEAYRFAKQYQKRLIVIPAYHDVNYYNRSLPFQNVLSFAHKVLFLSPLEKEQLQKHYRIDSNKLVQFTYCPYTKAEMESAQSKYEKKIVEIEQKLEKGSAITIGFVGQITLRKNFQFFADFIRDNGAELKSKKVRLRFLFAGARTNSSPQVEAMFKDLDAEIKFIYDFADKNAIYKQIDIFINPSEEESLGLVNFDALAQGLPVFVHKDSAFASLSNEYKNKILQSNNLTIQTDLFHNFSTLSQFFIYNLVYSSQGLFNYL